MPILRAEVSSNTSLTSYTRKHIHLLPTNTAYLEIHFEEFNHSWLSFKSFWTMGDNSSEEEMGCDWRPYSEREDWKDVTPLEQDDGSYPVVAIQYSAICKIFSFNDIVSKYS